MKSPSVKYRVMNYNYENFYIDYRFPKNRASHSVLPHRHGMDEFVLTETGATTMLVGDHIYRGEGKYLVFAPRGCVHEIINDDSRPYRRYCFSLDPTFIGGDARGIPDQPFILQLDDALFEVLSDITALLYKYLGTDGFVDSIPRPTSDAVTTAEASPARLSHLLELFLDELRPVLVKKLPALTLGSSAPKLRYVREICAYIGEHFDERLSLDLLSARYFISRAKLTHDFREVMNMSVGDYITLIRLNRSIPLLLGELSVSQIARQCGFASTSYYISRFSDKYAMTPAKYRTKLIGDLMPEQ